ncbi:MAG TPA: beta-ketoacyl-ACP synthase II [Coxiellaceae bacterium]|nr:beta-ketoacyl-ACP synthase II [Coxiellaceae bacterium]
MDGRRVVVTGMGIISPMGNNIATFRDNLLSGRSGIGPITKFDASELEVRITGEVRNFDPAEHMNPGIIKYTDPITQFGMAAAKQAIHDAGLDFSQFDPYRLGVSQGVGYGGWLSTLRLYKNFLENGVKSVDPFSILAVMPDAPGVQISLEYRLKGKVNSNNAACSSSAQAMEYAFDAIKGGKADIIVVLGTEAPLHPLSVAHFQGMRGAITNKFNDRPEEASRPFDAYRSGFVGSEGAAVLIFEGDDIAKARKTRIYAEMLGYGSTSDSYHIVYPTGEGAKQAMIAALKMSGIQNANGMYVNAHGTSTKIGDHKESWAIAEVFDGYSIYVSSVKSMLGHMIGASTAAETVASIIAMHAGFIPPTINLTNPHLEGDNACAPLNYVPNVAVMHQFYIFMKNSFGFGGHNDTIVFQRWRE